MNTIAAVLLALLVPIAWGLLSAWAFDKWRERRAAKVREEEKSRGSEAA
jgi:hypothetical protein